MLLEFYIKIELSIHNNDFNRTGRKPLTCPIDNILPINVFLSFKIMKSLQNWQRYQFFAKILQKFFCYFTIIFKISMHFWVVFLPHQVVLLKSLYCYVNNKFYIFLSNLKYLQFACILHLQMTSNGIQSVSSSNPRSHIYLRVCSILYAYMYLLSYFFRSFDFSTDILQKLLFKMLYEKAKTDFTKTLFFTLFISS